MPNTKLKEERSCVMCGEPDENGLYVLDMCRACYAYCYFWQQRTLADKMQRVKDLEKYSDRMAQITAINGRHLQLASSDKVKKR